MALTILLGALRDALVGLAVIVVVSLVLGGTIALLVRLGWYLAEAITALTDRRRPTATEDRWRD